MPETSHLRARMTISAALKCPLDAVGAGAGVETLPQWDSIGHINIVLEIEAELGRKLLSEEIAGISSVADIVLLYECEPASA